MLGSKGPNASELAHMGRCKELVCIPCLVRLMLHALPAEWVVVGSEDLKGWYVGLLQFHHFKSGNIRVGHHAGIGICLWHHSGNQAMPPDGWTHNRLRDRYGPSLNDGSTLFHETYGSDQELQELQDAVLSHFNQRSPWSV
jgi:hypothetical protein